MRTYPGQEETADGRAHGVVRLTAVRSFPESGEILVRNRYETLALGQDRSGGSEQGGGY